MAFFVSAILFCIKIFLKYLIMCAALIKVLFHIS